MHDHSPPRFVSHPEKGGLPVPPAWPDLQAKKWGTPMGWCLVTPPVSSLQPGVAPSGTLPWRGPGAHSPPPCCQVLRLAQAGPLSPRWGSNINACPTQGGHPRWDGLSPLSGPPFMVIAYCICMLMTILVLKRRLQAGLCKWGVRLGACGFHGSTSCLLVGRRGGW